jgi:hypothetical protein
MWPAAGARVSQLAGGSKMNYKANNMRASWLPFDRLELAA